jgi:hypothetical protein
MSSMAWMNGSRVKPAAPKDSFLGQAGDRSCYIKRIVFFQGFHHAAIDLAGGSRDENFEGHANERKLMRV